MKVVFTDHLISRLKLRKISKNLAKKVYRERKTTLYDTIWDHHIALSKQLFFGKIRLLVVAFDKFSDRVELITIYPTTEKEAASKIKSGRWKHEEN